jgi:hypothetical protein
VVELEKRDEAAYQETRAKKIQVQAQKFVKQQQNEMQALQKKIEMQEQE